MKTVLEQIVALLASDPRRKWTSTEIGEAVKISHNEFDVYVKRGINRNLFTRKRFEGMPYLRYFMTADQYAAYKSGTLVINRRKYRDRLPLLHDVKGPLPADADKFGVITETHDIPGRLQFLRELNDKTVFGGNHTLALIISDYERTLNMRKAITARLEAETA